MQHEEFKKDFCKIFILGYKTKKFIIYSTG